MSPERSLTKQGVRGKAIKSLQAAMVTMIKDLIDVPLGIPGAAEKAARDANFLRYPCIRDSGESFYIFRRQRLREMEKLAAALGAMGGISSQPTIDSTTVNSGGDRSPRDSYSAPRMAAGGIITDPMLLVDPQTGRTSGMIGEAGPEAVVSMRRAVKRYSDFGHRWHD